MSFLSIMFYDYSSLLILIVVAASLAIILVLVSYFFVLDSPDYEKLSTYECGYEPYDSSRHIFNIKFFLIALFFVIFDIEMLYLIPWSVSVSNLSLLGFWSVIDFVFELGLGFFYVWYTNCLDWK